MSEWVALERIAEAIKDSSPRQEIRAAPHLTGDAKENYYFGVGGKIFLGGPKNNQLLNATSRLALSSDNAVNALGGWERRERISGAPS
jgi:hypothetical protein